MTVERAKLLLAGNKVFLRASHNQRHQSEADQCRRNCCQRHHPVGLEHHKQTSYQKNNGRNKADDARLEGL